MKNLIIILLGIFAISCDPIQQSISDPCYNDSVIYDTILIPIDDFMEFEVPVYTIKGYERSIVNIAYSHDSIYAYQITISRIKGNTLGNTILTEYEINENIYHFSMWYSQDSLSIGKCREYDQAKKELIAAQKYYKELKRKEAELIKAKRAFKRIKCN